MPFSEKVTLTEKQNHVKIKLDLDTSTQTFYKKECRSQIALKLSQQCSDLKWKKDVTGFNEKYSLVIPSFCCTPGFSLSVSLIVSNYCMNITCPILTIQKIFREF